MDENEQIGVCLIVKNEAAHIGDCLTSAQALGPLLDGIYVYDTGSTDDTVAIAKAHGAVVVEGYWDGDFARARNAAQAMCQAPWVLAMDADERLVVNVDALCRLMQRAAQPRPSGRIQALRIAIADIREGREIQAHPHSRLFKNGGTVWTGRIHEQVELLDGEGMLSLDVPRSVLTLQHLGYVAGKIMDAKHRRNAAIAEAALCEAEDAGETDSPRLVRALVDLARTVSELDQSERSLSLLRRVRGTGSEPSYRNFGLEVLADSLIDAGHTNEAQGVIHELRSSGISSRDYCDWLTARLSMRLREVRPALDILRRLDVVANCMGVVAKPPLLLQARAAAAIACGEYLEAGACLIQLMGGHGAVDVAITDLMLKLTMEVRDEDVATLLRDCGPAHQAAILNALHDSPPRGPRVRAVMMRLAHTGASFVH